MVVLTLAFFLFFSLQFITYWATFYVAELLVKNCLEGTNLNRTLIVCLWSALFFVDVVSLVLLASGKLFALILFSLTILTTTVPIVFKGTHKGG